MSYDNADDVIRDMMAFDNEGSEFMTPVQYAKIRPVYAPQVYGWMKNGTLPWKYCDCGRKVINVEQADELLRTKGKLQPKGPENVSDPED